MKQKEGRLCGLLVKHCHASKFLQQRKRYELRPSRVNFLQQGECVALITRQDGAACRSVLAVLRFKECLQLECARLHEYSHLHCESEEDLRGFAWLKKTHCFAWHLELVACLAHPVCLPLTQGPECWLWFAAPQSQETSAVKKGSRLASIAPSKPDEDTKGRRLRRKTS